MSQSVAAWILSRIQLSLQTQDRFTLVLSGGSTPKPLYDLLAASPYREMIPWEKIHMFWGDERAVPFEDPRNNAKMAFDNLLQGLPIAPQQIHIMRTDIAPELAAAEYEDILHRYFGEEGPSFDLVLLGMGDDGHTLSLFPHTAVIHETRAWTKAYYLPAQDMYRITLTRTIVNRSAAIAFLTSGAAKAHALHEVLYGAYQPDLYPSQVIVPVAGELHWFVDQAAAGNLGPQAQASTES